MKFAIEVANAAPNTPIHFIIYQVATTLINATSRYVRALNRFSFLAIIILRKKL